MCQQGDIGVVQGDGIPETVVEAIWSLLAAYLQVAGDQAIADLDQLGDRPAVQRVADDQIPILIELPYLFLGDGGVR